MFSVTSVLAKFMRLAKFKSLTGRDQRAGNNFFILVIAGLLGFPLTNSLDKKKKKVTFY